MTCTASYSSNTYNITISPNSVELVSATANTYNISINTYTTNVAVASSGQQGPRGDSVSNAYIDSGSLYIVVTDASGNYSNTILAGSVVGNFNPVITDPVVGDIIQYTTNNTFVNYSLTTSRILDIDNTNKQDGALLVYSGNSYKATTQINNANTAVIGGTY